MRKIINRKKVLYFAVIFTLTGLFILVNGCSSDTGNKSNKIQKAAPVVMSITVDKDIFIPGVEQVEFSIIGPEIKHKYWRIDIRDKDGNRVRNFRGKGKIKRVLTWDGKNDREELVKLDKQFTIKARGIYPSGEEWESNSVTIKSLIKLVVGTVIKATTFSIVDRITPPSIKTATDQIYKILEEHQKIRLLIKGHVNPIKWPAERLLKLSQYRAEAVMKYLIDKGIDPGRLEAKGYGGTMPLTDGKTPEDRKKNHRIEFEVIE